MNVIVIIAHFKNVAENTIITNTISDYQIQGINSGLTEGHFAESPF